MKIKQWFQRLYIEQAPDWLLVMLLYTKCI